MTPKSSKFLVFSLVSAVGFTALTAPFNAKAQDAPDSFEDCAAVPDDVERLACYDEVATEKAPDTIRAMREAKAEQQQREFGLDASEVGDELNELGVTVAKWRLTKERKIELTMENGQVWEQIDVKVVYYPKKPFGGRIYKSLMGAWIFSPETKDRAIKVKRVK